MTSMPSIISMSSGLSLVEVPAFTVTINNTAMLKFLQVPSVVKHSKQITSLDGAFLTTSLCVSHVNAQVDDKLKPKEIIGIIENKPTASVLNPH